MVLLEPPHEAASGLLLRTLYSEPHPDETAGA